MKSLLPVLLFGLLLATTQSHAEGFCQPYLDVAKNQLVFEEAIAPSEDGSTISYSCAEVMEGIFEAKALPSMGDVVIPVRWVYTGEMTAAQFTSMVMSWNNTDAFQLRFTATTTPANKIELELFPLPVQP